MLPQDKRNGCALYVISCRQGQVLSLRQFLAAGASPRPTLRLYNRQKRIETFSILIHRLIFELNGGFLFALLRIFMIKKIKVRKSVHLQFDIIAYLTTKRASYKYNRRFFLHTIDGI